MPDDQQRVTHIVHHVNNRMQAQQLDQNRQLYLYVKNNTQRNSEHELWTELYATLYTDDETPPECLYTPRTWRII